MLTFTGAARKRSPDAVARAAASINVETAALAAIIQVETSGSGFDAQGRPKALFEPHRFYRELAGSPAKLKKAVAAGLAYPNWGEQPYPKDSYPRIMLALKIDETAALRATSWGLPQILGSNCVTAGFPTPQAMLAAFVDGEDAQIAAMASFIAGNGLAAALRARNWGLVAAGYNGKRYREGKYDTKLAAAYARRPASEKGETKAPVKVFGIADAPAPQPPAGYDPELEKTQRLLDAAGYPVGKIDGRWGEMTRAALRGFKAAYNDTTDDDLPLDNSYGRDVQVALFGFRRPVADERATATAKDLRRAGDPQVSFLTRARNWAMTLFVGDPIAAGWIETMFDTRPWMLWYANAYWAMPYRGPTWPPAP